MRPESIAAEPPPETTTIYAQLTSRRWDEEARKVFASQYVV
jgi:hypothetical protein